MEYIFNMNIFRIHLCQTLFKIMSFLYFSNWWNNYILCNYGNCCIRTWPAASSLELLSHNYYIFWRDQRYRKNTLLLSFISVLFRNLQQTKTSVLFTHSSNTLVKTLIWHNYKRKNFWASRLTISSRKIWFLLRQALRL